MSFGNTQSFCPPWFSGKISRSFTFISRNHPIGTDHSIIIIFFSKQILYYIFTKSIGIISSILCLIIRYCIIRHNGRSHSCFSIQFESSFCKRFQMCFKVATRIYCKFTESPMSITASLLGSSTRPVFNHCIYTFIAPSVGNLIFTCRRLKSIDISTSHICC